MIYENGTLDTYSDDAIERRNKINELLPRYLNIAKSCPPNTLECTQKYISRHDKTKGYIYKLGEGRKTYALANGTIITITSGTDGELCTQTRNMNIVGHNGGNWGTYGLSCGNIYVDLNGAKGPNKTDIDMFGFKLVRDGVIPSGSLKEGVWTETFENQCLGKNVSGMPTHCTAWVLAKRNMDYLRCPEKLGWNKASTCNLK